MKRMHRHPSLRGACVAFMTAAGAAVLAAGPARIGEAWRDVCERRMAALSPERPLEYLVLAEDALDHAVPGEAGAADRLLARQLAALAGAIDVVRVGPSAALLLADTAPAESERLRMLAIAEVLGGVAAPTASAEHADAAAALLQAFAHYRRGDGARAKDALARHGAAALLDAHPEVLAGGSERFRTECDAMRGGLAPAFSAAQAEALQALTAAVIAGGPRRWSESTLRGGAAPLAEIDIADPRSLFGVDPALCLWRGGAWVRPPAVPAPAVPAPAARAPAARAPAARPPVVPPRDGAAVR